MKPSIVLADLRRRVTAIEGVAKPRACLPFGIDAIDTRLPGGGIAFGALHEVAGSAELCDDAAAAIFLAGVLARIEGPVFWCVRWRDLFTPAVDLAGLEPDRVIHVEVGSDANVLLAMEECLRHPGLAGVVGEVAKLSTTASKRLQLAAEGSGVTAFVLRRAAPVEAMAEGTAAVTRWRVLAAPSEPLGIPSIGRARWNVHLERVRVGEPRSWLVEACDAQGCIALPAKLVDRPAAADERRVAG